ncbi:O-antigen ligase family protein [Streptomyces sp. R21]|uniref:O-antigen ligase family protein n=1 Tax=Streptomyces sp. R21 TaxID=3238627 RepID=A0AB39P140_9ACTN
MTPQQSSTALVIGISALVSLIPWTVALRRARSFGDWDLTATLVFVMGVLANLPTVAYVIHTGRSERLDSRGDVVIGFPAWVNHIGTLTNGLMLAACVLFVLQRLLFARATINPAPLIALVLVLVLTASDGLHGQELLAPRQVTLLAALLAAAVARAGRSALLGGAAVAMMFTVLSGIEAVVEPATVLRECEPDNQCGVLGILYAGVFTNENIYSLLIMVCIPFVWLGLRGRVRVVLACYLAFVAVATGSRLASVTAVATVAFLMLMRPRLPDEEPRGVPGISPGRILAAVPVLGAVAAMGALLPFHHRGLGDLGMRATIWDMARSELPDSVLLGFGGKAWSAKYPGGEIPAAVSPSLHNEWIDVLYAGGIIGLALFVGLLAYLLLRGGTTGFPIAASLLLPVLLASVLERPWSFGISNSLTFALVAVTLVPLTARTVTGRARQRLGPPHSTAALRAASPAAPESGSSPAAEPVRTPRR